MYIHTYICMYIYIYIHIYVYIYIYTYIHTYTHNFNRTTSTPKLCQAPSRACATQLTTLPGHTSSVGFWAILHIITYMRQTQSLCRDFCRVLFRGVWMICRKQGGCRICVCVCVCVCVRACVCRFLCVYIRVYVYIYIYMCVYIYIYIYMDRLVDVQGGSVASTAHVHTARLYCTQQDSIAHRYVHAHICANTHTHIQAH
jgi:hypothetical protein